MKARNAKMMFGDALGTLSRMLTERENIGAAAVEFAIFAPFFMIIIAGTVDLGYLIYTASELTAAVSAGSQYAEKNAAQVGTIQTIIENGRGGATSAIDVNNGDPDATHCYCPTGSPGNWTWGTTVTCGNNCPGGVGVAGQFVTITASRTVSPLFPTFGLVNNGTISRSAIAETKRGGTR